MIIADRASLRSTCGSLPFGGAKARLSVNGVVVDLKLQGKTALVTGASKGTGAAIARQLSREGCKVALTSRTQQDLDEVAASIAGETGHEVIAVAGDWRETDDVQRVVQQVIGQLGRVDIFVPNAGDAPGGDFLSTTEEEWMRGISLKFLGHVRGCRAVLPHMVEQGGGAIVMVVGNDGLKPPYGEVIPGACNAADINFATAIAEQFGQHGIRVNTVNPGPIDTGRWAKAEARIGKQYDLDADKVRKLVLASLPLGYICTPEEIANVVTFVASPMASYVNGANIAVDGAQRKAMMHAHEVFDVVWS